MRHFCPLASRANSIGNAKCPGEYAGRRSSREAVCALTDIPNNFQEHLERGLSLQRAGRLDEAADLYNLVLRHHAANDRALYLLGILRLQQSRHDEAIKLLREALAQRPDASDAKENPEYADAWAGLGTALRAVGQHQEALVAFQRAISFDSGAAHLYFNCGTVLEELARPADALAMFDRSLELNSGLGQAHNSRGKALRGLRRLQEAVAAFDIALRLNPGNAIFLYNRSLALLDLGQRAMALRDIDSALASMPANASLHYARGIAMEDFRNFGEALRSFDTALQLDPKHPHAFGAFSNAALRACDWARVAQITAELPNRISTGRDILPPFVLLDFEIGGALQRIATANYNNHYLQQTSPTPPPTKAPHGKIRLAYLSADFHTHATAHLMAGVFERHDRDRFETHAISFGPDDKSPMRARLKAAFDHFHDVASCSDDQVAMLIRELHIDIAVDLKGHTRDARPMILARRPAPIQISYLGYPGTTGDGSGIDYILADSTVLPLDEQAYYSEEILHLPGCYQANDSKRIVGASTSRGQENLPEAGFVFCCFNNSWKITAPIFAVWMRLLANVEGSALWLLDDNAAARANLTSAARARSIDPARLIFAKHTPAMEHLGRHRLADLFLDTQPYGAHTGASDALWAGLPLLTLQGTSFPGRVAASLLKAVGLPELIAHDMAEYERLALSLALEPTRLAALRDRLVANISTSELFNTARFCAGLEAQYIALACGRP